VRVRHSLHGSTRDRQRYQRPIHRRKIKRLRIKTASDPFEHGGLFLVLSWLRKKSKYFSLGM
jgi:hypothetical protein